MKTIVVGSVCTDLVLTGLPYFPGPGEHVDGDNLLISPGGKGRNIADMLARLSPQGSVAMLSKTVRDSYGLWRVPLDALDAVSVHTEYIQVLDENSGKSPCIAFIPVAERGENQMFVLPGINRHFEVEDVTRATSLFKEVGEQGGMLILTLEYPFAAVLHAVKLARTYGIKVMLDPGGITKRTDFTRLAAAGLYCIKPNEHETNVLTGIDVRDLASAKRAADKFYQLGVEVVLITSGGQGAYLCTKEQQLHIPVPQVDAGYERDETGCGDQSMAAFCAFLQAGKPIRQAAELAVLAGTLQFYRTGIRPVDKNELLLRYN